jgi:hypothetical protein
LGFAAGREENVIPHVNRKPGASAASTSEVVMGGDSRRTCVYDSDIAAVPDIYTNVAIAIGNSLLRHPSEVDGTHHGAIGCVDYRRIRHNVTENVHPLVEWVE